MLDGPAAPGGGAVAAMSIDLTAPWAYRAGVIADPEALFAQVTEEVDWTDQMRARRTASMGRPYNYAGASYPEADWHPAVWQLAERLAPIVNFTPTNCLLNAYPTGDHRIGWHADDVDILETGTGIAIISLGAARTIQLRSGSSPDFIYEPVPLAPGSLFWMSPELQATHRHGIRREPGAGPRVSLTFRRIIRESPVVDRARWGS